MPKSRKNYAFWGSWRLDARKVVRREERTTTHTQHLASPKPQKCAVTLMPLKEWKLRIFNALSWFLIDIQKVLVKRSLKIQEHKIENFLFYKKSKYIYILCIRRLQYVEREIYISFKSNQMRSKSLTPFNCKRNC